SVLLFFFYSSPHPPSLHSFPTRRSSDLMKVILYEDFKNDPRAVCAEIFAFLGVDAGFEPDTSATYNISGRLRYPWLHDLLFCRRSEEHTSELQSRGHLVCRLLREKKKRF